MSHEAIIKLLLHHEMITTISIQTPSWFSKVSFNCLPASGKLFFLMMTLFPPFAFFTVNSFGVDLYILWIKYDTYYRTCGILKLISMFHRTKIYPYWNTVSYLQAIQNIYHLLNHVWYNLVNSSWQVWHFPWCNSLQWTFI